MTARSMSTFIVVCGLLGTSCDNAAPDSGGAGDNSTETITNRIDIPPRVVRNLGITFAAVSRGKVGRWLDVPGELYVPETHQWRLRAHAHGRVRRVAPRWTSVQPGDVVAEIVSPELRQAQQELLAAITHLDHTQDEAEGRGRTIHRGADGVKRCCRGDRGDTGSL